MDPLLPEPAEGLGALARDDCDLAPDPLRRKMLARAATAGITLALGNGLLRGRAYAAETVGPTDVFVLVFLRGGLDGLNTVVPYGDPAYTTALRPNVGIRDSLPLGDGFFGAHPALAPLIGAGKAWDPTTGIGDLAFVHATGTAANTRSHFDAQDLTDRATPTKSLGPKNGWLARHLRARSETSRTLRAVGIAGATPLSLYGPTVAPILLKAPLALSTFTGTSAETALASLYSGFTHSAADAATKGLAAVTDLRGLGTYTPRFGVTYGTDVLGAGLKTVAQLVKADPTGSPVRFGLEAVAIDHCPYDLHRGMGTSTAGPLRDRLTEVGNALAAFRDDLQDLDGTSGKRFWDRVTVCVVSEFGRRPEENGAGGTEHGHGGVAMVLGGGVKGKATGRTSNVWLRDGRWPGVGVEHRVDGDLAVTTDVRDLLREIATVRLGAPAATIGDVFPYHAAYAPLGFALPK